jgi:hypothetical protein
MPKLRIQAVAIAVVLYTIAKFTSPPPEPSTTSSYKGPQRIIASNKTKTAIWHYPSYREICVKWDYSQTQCPHPDLLGRISGSSLAVLDDWKDQSRIVHHKDGTVFDTLYCGSYKNAWLPPGRYNLEIIVVVCSSFGLSSPMRINNFTKWLEYDFKNDCLEDPMNSQITSSSSSLIIETEISRIPEGNKGESLEGRWRMEDKSADYNYKPMSTRYQPQNCRDKRLPERCTTPMNNSNFEALTFVWRNNTFLEELKKYQLDLGFGKLEQVDSASMRNKVLPNLEMRAHGGTGLKVDPSKGLKGATDESKICIVGYSHSYHLVYAFFGMNLGHRFIWAPANYPSDLTTNFFEQYYHTRNCTKFVIGVGQWAAGWTGNFPYSFKQWRDEMTSVVTNEEIFKINGDIKLFLRSIHHNPIGDMIGKCQPTDWRSPTVIDSYNYILEKLVLNVNNSRVGYLDTTFITKPVWDSSYDWCHLPHSVSLVEASYIAHVLLA